MFTLQERRHNTWLVISHHKDYKSHVSGARSALTRHLGGQKVTLLRTEKHPSGCTLYTFGLK